MALESFYGGKPGISPVIRASFKYISTQDPAYDAKKGQSVKVSDLSNREKALFEKILGYSLNDNDNVTWNETTLAPFTMDECFKDSTYHDVWYNELCIIDTENKLNPNNGKLFRRTLKRVDTVLNAGDTDYAEYIGQIVGPSGGVPNIRFGSIDDMRKQATGLQNTLPSDNISENNPADITSWDYSYPIKDNDTVIITTANPADDNRSDDYEKIAVLNSEQSGSIQLVPGKVDDNTYNDNIEYTWCNVRRTLTNGNAQDAWIYLGFKIPYATFDAEGKEENYTYSGDIFIDKSDESQHPFYKNYEFHIPRGTRGIGPEEIILVRNREEFFNNVISPQENNNATSQQEDDTTLQQENKLYYKNAIIYNVKKDLYSIKENADYLDSNGILHHKDEELNDQETEDALKKSFWVAKWTLFNPKTEDFKTVYQFIDNYRDISDVELNTDIDDSENYGNLTIHYSTEDDKTLQIPLVKSIDVNTTNNSNNYGKVTTTFSNGTDIQWEGTLPLIKNITYYDKKQTTDDQSELEAGFYFEYAGDKTIHLDKTIHDIDKLEIINGHLYVTYKDTDGSIDLGLIKASPTLGAVISDTINASTSTNPNEDVFITTINNYCNTLNNSTTSPHTINGDNNNNIAEIWSDGTITIKKTRENNIIDTIDKTGGFILITVNKAASGNNTPESKNYLCYYDVNQERWTAVSFSGGSSGSSAATNIYVNEGDTIFPPANEVGEAEFKFDTVDELSSSPSSLLMPWSSSVL